MNKLSTRMRISILFSAIWILAFLSVGTDNSFVFVYGIMPAVIAWGLFWINSRWSRIGIIITFIWIVLLETTHAFSYEYLILMLIPALLWGIALSRDRWWK